MAKKNTSARPQVPSLQDQIREAAEADLLTFIRLVAPHRVLGGIHEEVIGWWTRQDSLSHQLTLLPRGHQKSMLIAYRAAWEITRNPAVTILYISSTSNLAEKQLKAIQDILTSDTYRKYWPKMVNDQEGKREKWTNSEISVDHPLRKQEGVRDPTVFTAGLTTSITGLHCDIAILDDVVVKENAYTDDGRTKVKEQYSLLSSIENPGAKEWAVGTRYHPKDLYQDLMEMVEDTYDEAGEYTGSVNVYEVFERKVENRGDGTGEFLWPRQRRNDGKWFGFNAQVLAKKRAQYLDKAQYRAQYYNDPNDPDNDRIGAELFQYYDPNHLNRRNGKWYFKGTPLNVYAAIDFAYSFRSTADYTAIVVIGIDPDSNIYVLSVNRFRTERISDYFKEILAEHIKWDFRKIRAEVTSGQKAIVRELKEQYIRPNGLALSVDEHAPNRHMGGKEDRINAILEPRYTNLKVWHYKGGNCQLLEEELRLAHPPHDDIKDALASAIEIAIAPTGHRLRRDQGLKQNLYNSKFGGIAHG